jgi:hypothetical protein
MANFLDAFDLPKLNQDDINHLSRCTTSNETEAIKSLPQRRAQDQIDSLPNSTRPVMN